LAALLVVLTVVLAGCGGGGGKKEPIATQLVTGPGFAFEVPDGWLVTRKTRTITVAPAGAGPELVQVLYFRLGKPFRPSLWTKVVREIDAVAKQLATQLKGTVSPGRTVRVGGIRGRQYEISFTKGGTELRERITFLLRARREFELLCQWSTKDGEPEACRVLTASFRPG
jgi:hypothetical protein